MKVFVAGASGAIGRPLLERLTRAGHEVTGMVHSAEGAGRLRQLGAEPVQAMTIVPQLELPAVYLQGV
jgi:uncharacterized protein YbjT (DUF2867 family)